jgi:hypothetical protein
MNAINGRIDCRGCRKIQLMSNESASVSIILKEGSSLLRHMKAEGYGYEEHFDNDCDEYTSVLYAENQFEDIEKEIIAEVVRTELV